MTGGEDGFLVEDGRVTWTGDGERLSVTAWGPDAVRVQAVIGPAVVDTRWALLDPPAGASPRIAVDEGGATLVNGAITARIDAEVWDDFGAGYAVLRARLTITDADGRVLLQELGPGGSRKLRARRWEALPGGAHRLTASFVAQEGERLYGMGLYQEGLFDLKGSTLELAHRNSQASVPFVLSSLGYGMLWHDPAVGRATFGTNRTEWIAEATDQLDYWVVAGSSPKAIASRYADAVGHAPMMPERGLGFWQCKLRYWNQEQLLEVAREHVRRGLPLDVVVADFFHWPRMGDYRFEEEFWPDPAAMVRELRGLGVELMVSVWPQVSLESENYLAFRRGNALARTTAGMDPQMGFEGPSMFVDVTADRGRELLWELCRQNYHELGIRTFWLDEAEPEWGAYDFANYRYAAGPVQQVGNVYPQQFARTFWEGQTAAGQTDVVNLVRCVWAGSQRYGALVWTGDIDSSWEALRLQITAGLQTGIAGIPWFTTDIGGFHGGVTEDPVFHELLIRWFQFAAFCPVMRLHGDRRPQEPVTAADGSRRSPSGAGNELWSFGPEVYDVLEHFVHLRERLRPYLREVMAEAHEAGQPVMRTLFHEFPEDRAAWDVADEFMLGPDLLVAPVVEAGGRTRSVHLPAGATWTSLQDGTQHAGGRRVQVRASLQEIPVFARAAAAERFAGLMEPIRGRPKHI